MPPEAASAPKQPNPVIVLREYYDARIDSLRTALPPHINPARFISAVMTACQINTDLLACDRRSLFIASMRCAQDGLLPDGTEAALVPYKDKANYVPMYQGLLKKFRNSGQFKWITAGIAYEGEEYQHWIDENGEHFKHVPSNDSPDRKMRRAYAIAHTKDGGLFVADMSPSEVDKRRKMSRATREDAPWRVWPDEMTKKTVLKVLSKLLPKSSDIDAFLERDEDEALGVETVEALSDRRGAAVGSLMDHFAAEATSPAADVSEPTAAADGGREEEPRAGGSGEKPAQPPAAAADVVSAYERGKEARAAGHQRKALPPEYRDATRTREAVSWQAGFDGAEKPTFGEEK